MWTHGSESQSWVQLSTDFIYLKKAGKFRAMDTLPDELWEHIIVDLKGAGVRLVVCVTNNNTDGCR